jgi:hypothetical protein
VSGRDRWFALALRAYPRRYRTERQDEIMATLIESAEMAGWPSMAADGLDLMVQGVRMRTGLSADRYGGRVLQLAALPGFVMAAAFAAWLFIFGEVPSRYGLFHYSPHFGPFQTIGAAVYLVWIIAALGALVAPRLQRTLATLCILATVISIPIGDAFFSRPSLEVLVVLVGLGLPCAVAPPPDRLSQANRPVALGVGLVTLASLVIMKETTSTRYSSFYRFEMYHLTTFLPYLAALALVAVCCLLILHKPDWIGAGAVVLVPWFFVGAIGRAPSALSFNVADELFVSLIVLWLVVNWALDLRRPLLSDGTVDGGHPT